MKKRITVSLMAAVLLMTSVLGGCGGKNDTTTAQALGYGEQVALIRFEEEPLNDGMQFTLDGLDYDPTVGKLGGREYYKLDKKTAELRFKLDEDTAEKLEGKDIFFKLEYNENSSKELKLEFTAKSGKSETEIQMLGTSAWGGKSVKIEDFKYKKDAEYDFKLTMGTATQLWIHSASIVAVEKREASYPAFVKSDYQSSDKVLITGNVLDYGAVGDGKTDDTVAFMAAVDAMADIGGTLYVPKGTYLITQHFDLPRGLSLVGDFNAPTADSKKVDGTVLALDPLPSSEGNETATIGMHSGTNMNGFTVWYPSQTLKDGKVIEYPYAIQNVHNGATVVENVNLVNVYNGIDHGSVTNQNQSMLNIYGTPLHKGGYISDANEVGRNEAINFSPEYWLESGLQNVPDKKILTDYLKDYAIGFHIGEVDWHYLSDINISGYNIGVMISSCFGRVYDLNVTDCETCVYIDKVTYYGGQFTYGVLKASGSKNAAALRIGEECGNNGITCVSMHFESSGDYAVYHMGEAPLSIQDSYIKSSAASLYANQARVSLIGCELVGEKALLLDENAGKSSVINCTAQGAFEAKVSENLTVSTVENLKTATLDTEKMEQVQVAGAKKYTRKNTGVLVNAADHGLSVESEDNAAALQAAIDKAAENGGTVYVPAGTYRIESPVTVKSNVTLLGSCDTFHSAIDSKVTYFVTDYGKNQPDSVLFTLEENSQARGFSVSYDKIPQAGETPYGWTFRGTGKDITFANIVVTGGFKVADFETNKCDNHYIENIAFVAYDTGIAVSGENGVMRWCTSNPATYWDNPFSEEKDWDSSWTGVLMTKLLEDSTAYRVNNAKNEIMMLCMVFGVNKGVHVKGESELYLIGQGVDYSENTLYVEDSANIVATDIQGVKSPGDSTSVIYTDKNYTGTLTAYNTTGWHQSGDVIKANGGNVNIIGGVFFQCGNSALNQTGGNVVMNGVITVRRNLSDITATNGVLSAYGNIVTARIPRFDIASSVEYVGDVTK